MSTTGHGLLSRVRRRLGVHEVTDLRARAQEVDLALAETARLDALLAPRVAELEQAAVSVAEKRLRARGRPA